MYTATIVSAGTVGHQCLGRPRKPTPLIGSLRPRLLQAVLRLRHKCAVVIATLFVENGIRFGPATQGLENIPSGVKETTYIDCPCRHASDRRAMLCTGHKGSGRESALACRTDPRQDSQTLRCSDSFRTGDRAQGVINCFVWSSWTIFPRCCPVPTPVKIGSSQRCERPFRLEDLGSSVFGWRKLCFGPP